jgi:hypothetical protein
VTSLTTAPFAVLVDLRVTMPKDPENPDLYSPDFMSGLMVQTDLGKTGLKVTLKDFSLKLPLKVF